MPFAGRSTKVLKAETSRIFFFEHNKDVSGAARVTKPNESQKARALWKMKAAKDRERIFMTQDAKTTFWEE